MKRSHFLIVAVGGVVSTLSYGVEEGNEASAVSPNNPISVSMPKHTGKNEERISLPVMKHAEKRSVTTVEVAKLVKALYERASDLRSSVGSEAIDFISKNKDALKAFIACYKSGSCVPGLAAELRSKLRGTFPTLDVSLVEPEKDLSGSEQISEEDTADPESEDVTEEEVIEEQPIAPRVVPRMAPKAPEISSTPIVVKTPVFAQKTDPLVPVAKEVKIEPSSSGKEYDAYIRDVNEGKFPKDRIGYPLAEALSNIEGDARHANSAVSVPARYFLKENAEAIERFKNSLKTGKLPFDRGELFVRTRTKFPGYFR